VPESCRETYTYLQQNCYERSLREARFATRLIQLKEEIERLECFSPWRVKGREELFPFLRGLVLHRARKALGVLRSLRTR
jgi:hypothetical protein